MGYLFPKGGVGKNGLQKEFRVNSVGLPVSREFNDLIVDRDKLRVVVSPAVPLDQVLPVNGDREEIRERYFV